MLRTLKLELYKMWCDRRFLISLMIAILIGVGNVIEHAIRNSEDLRVLLESSDGIILKNPAFSISTPFLCWLGQDHFAFSTALYFLILPLLVSSAYVYAVLKEQKTGYNKQCLLKSSRSVYFYSRIISVFASGFVIATISLLVNFVGLSLFLPLIKPDVYFDIYSGSSILDYGGNLLYLHPYLHVLMRIFIISIFAGLVALLTLAVGFFTKHIYVAVFAPFFVLQLLDYFSVRLATLIDYSSYSPLVLLHGGNRMPQRIEVLILYFSVSLIGCLAIVYWRGRKHDVFLTNQI